MQQQYQIWIKMGPHNKKETTHFSTTCTATSVQRAAKSSKSSKLQLCNEDTSFAVMCVTWLLSMTPQAATTCCRRTTSCCRCSAAARSLSSLPRSSTIDNMSMLPVASLIAARTRTRQRTACPHCKVEVARFGKLTNFSAAR